MRARRDAFVAERISRGDSPAIQPSREILTLFKPGMVVASYIALGSEADPAPVAAAARYAGCIIALPHVTSKAAPMRFLRHDAGDVLEIGAFGLSQPHAAAPQISPDLVLIPLIACTRGGIRLGQGAGHYDRALAALPDARRIGIAWSCQIVEDLPQDAWDVPLHAILTEPQTAQQGAHAAGEAANWIVP
jgi:5-formyltetrahydrofolate cyclo-ligase